MKGTMVVNNLSGRPTRWGMRSAWRDPRIIGFLALFMLTIALRVPFVVYTSDDAFITFRYARNIASGLGFVYNPGEPVLGTTTVLYTLLLAGLGKLGLDFVLLGKLINILAEVGTGVILYLMMCRDSPRLVAVLAAGLYAVSPSNCYWSASGMETGLYTSLNLLTLYLYTEQRWVAMSLAGVLLTLTRPDGWLTIVTIAVAWALERKLLITGVKTGTSLIALQLPWFLFAFSYFGSPLPNSIVAKAVAYRVPGILDWLYNFWQVFYQRGGWAGLCLILGLFLLGAVSVLTIQARNRYLPFLFWFLLYSAAFTLARAGPYRWYSLPLMPVLFMFVCLGGYNLYRRAAAIPRLGEAFAKMPRRVLILVLLPAVLLAISTSVLSTWEAAQDEGNFEQKISRPLGLWLRDNTAAGATVALESIGGVGWYSERYIVDEGGLISKKVVAVNAQTPGEINVVGILQTFGPDYYVAWEKWELETRFLDPQARAWLDQHYEELAQYHDGQNTWFLFRRRSLPSN